MHSGHALVVAVANYDHIRGLPPAVLNDARDIAAVLISQQHCGYEQKNVKLMLDADATLANLRDALHALSSSARPDDTVVIFFSGHGDVIGNPTDETSALLTVDCKPNELDTTSLSEAEFSAALHRIKAKRLLVLLDSCHSGGAGNLKTGQVGGPFLGYSEKTLARLSEGAGRVLIASSRASETSLVLPGWRNSVFTHYLLEGLRGDMPTQGDGVIRVFEIFNYVQQKVRNEVPDQQHPIFKASNLEDNFPVALDHGGAKKLSSPLPSCSGENDEWARLADVLPDLYPTGPTDQEIWARAGGDLSRLRLGNTGRANWFAALRTLRHGGGGLGITRESLIRVALEDYPHHHVLAAIRGITH